MSLKARIEAVIYAAEEPVTLPQLAAIFREEALASRADRLTAAADPEAPIEGDLGIQNDAGEAIAAELLPPDAEASVAAPEAVSRFEAPASQSAAGESWTQEAEPEAESGPGPESPEAVPSEPGAQNSSDAEVAVPDFAGEPQPFPNEPGEATTPGHENNPGLTPDEERPDHAHAPATNAPQEAEPPSEPEPEPEPEPEAAPEPEPPSAESSEFASTPDAAPEAGLDPVDSAPTFETSPEAPAVPAPEEEKKAARQREREVREEIRRVIDELMADYAATDRGIEIREIAGGFRMATRAEYHDAVRAFVRSLRPPMKLSLQALETLAVIAYKQPVTAPEIGEIRGVDSGGVLGSLVARKLITTAGRKQVIGRPILYKTTREFLLRFGLKDLNELPSLEEFEKMASELAEQDEAPSAEQIPFAESDMAAREEEEAEEMAAAAAGGLESDESALSAVEPEVGAAATEPAELRTEDSETDGGPGDGDLPPPTKPPAPPAPPEPPAEEEPRTDGGPGDGDPPPPTNPSVPQLPPEPPAEDQKP